MTSTPLHALGAAELGARYRSGELSPVDAVQSVFERIDAWEPQINALYRSDRDTALAAARDAGRRWREGRQL